MRPTTKYLAYGGIAVCLLGAPLVVGTGVSVAGGSGTLLAGTLKDMLPAFVESFQNYTPDQTDGIFGETAPAPTPAPGADGSN